MRAADLDLRELLQFEPSGGVIRFGGQRALLFDAVALGILRGELIDALGVQGARSVLTRFGYAHGWRTAENLRSDFPWDDEREWRRAGGRLHTLQGLCVVEPSSSSSGTGPAPFAESFWHDSYEAEQHLLHQGVSHEPVCWTLSGFASGYLSHCNGREVHCIEDFCRAKGDTVCHLVGRFREDWGDGADVIPPTYRRDCQDTALTQVTTELRRVERQLAGQSLAGQSLTGQSLTDKALAGIVAQSSAMQRVLDLAQRVARVDSTIVITGESGVGKERVARLIHERSPRAEGPFVAINCAAVPESLLESELFGHSQGSFTGATHERAGLFEAANGGSLFLDEVGELPALMQVKLLRALQEREVRRVGENKSRPIDVRVLAATHRDLVAEVEAGRYRQDLYYRLRVVELNVPPLRDRRDDILALARSFLAQASLRTGRAVTNLAPRAAHHLSRYDWPGNVRELENAIERAVVLAQGARIELEDLPEEIQLALPRPFTPGEVRPLEAIERDYILAVVRANDGNRARAAEQLQIGTATLYRKLKQYGSSAPPR
jgi:two-component system response regulator HydG